MNTEAENTKLRRFLLGNESEADAEEIGAQILADRDFDEKMSFAEEELVEEFLDGALTAGETELFYKNFLTPERAGLLKETAFLRNYSVAHSTDALERTPEEKKPEGFLDGLRSLLSLNLRPIAAVLVILVVAGIGWRVFLYDAGGLTQIEKDYAALNAKDLSSAPEVANLSNKSLIPGTFRAADSTSTINSANLTENVLFRLALPAETPRETLVDLELERGGQTVFRQKGLRVYQNPNGQELKVILPKSVLSKGTYQIKLSSGANYGFAVE